MADANLSPAHRESEHGMKIPDGIQAEYTCHRISKSTARDSAALNGSAAKPCLRLWTKEQD
jgi:hypothetical protein